MTTTSSSAPKAPVREVCLSDEKLFALAQKLSCQVGGLASSTFRLTSPRRATRVSDMFPDTESALRTYIREGALEQLRGGRALHHTKSPLLHRCRGEERVLGLNSSGEELYFGPLANSPDNAAITPLLRPPKNRAYQWYTIIYWRLGSLETLQEHCFNEQGCLVLKYASLLLFPDEVAALAAGEIIKPLEIGGLTPDFGLVAEALDAYHVAGDDLFRLYAHFQD